jgi:transglutaminase-like putative cysteine protease
VVGWRRLLSSGDPEHSVPLRLWTLAAVVVSIFAVTAHDDFLEHRLVIPLLVALGFGFSYWRRARPNWWVKIILAVLCLRVGWEFLRDVVGDPYHTSVPLTVLLLWLQTLHSFDVPARRDLLFSLLSSVILMAVAAAFALDHTFLVYLVLYALVAVQALAHNAWQAAREAAATPSDRTGEGPARPASARRAPAASVGAQGGLMWAAVHLLVVVLVGAAVVFVFTPRFEGGRLTTLPFSPQRFLLDVLAGRLWNPAYPQSGGLDSAPPPWNPRGYFGFSPVVDLRLRGRLDDTVVMRVRATRQHYWRALVFDTYTGVGWKISDPGLTLFQAGSPPIHLVHRQDEVLVFRHRPERVVQSFYIEVEQPNVVFAAPLAERLFLPSDRVYLDRLGSMRLPTTLKPGDVYSVVSRVFAYDPAVLRAADGAPPRSISERYLALPPIPDRVRVLAERLVAGAPTVYDRVVAVNRFLQTAYRYDLTIPPQRRPGDAVDYFLFEERRGYCEQFASAMVVLLRSVGIPARLVTGYLPGTLDPITGLLEVRNSDAHAWVEVYFAGVGWVEFEPTPGFPDAADLGGPVVGRWVWQDLLARVRGSLSALAERSPAVDRLVSAAGAAAQAALWALVAVGGVLVTARTWRALGPRAARRMPGSEVEDLYAQMCAALARRGIVRAPAETVREFCRRAEDRTGLSEVRVISTLAEAAAYGGAPVTPEDLDAARVALASLRLRLRGRDGHRR